MDVESIVQRVEALSAEWAGQRVERQRRRELDARDFDRLAQAGFQLTGVPAEQGGLWQDPARSTRAVCELLRILARADSSVALVCAMHPTVLSFWLAAPPVDEQFRASWDEQKRAIVSSVLAGAWWGTLTSEPGGGGDLMKTSTRAIKSGSSYLLSGDKGFGSGSGITEFMLTVALPEGEERPDLFYLDVRGGTWDGSTGMHLQSAWDGQGMGATQSHTFRFENYPATRVAWPRNLTTLGASVQPSIRCCFAAVTVGIIEVAVSSARDRLAHRQGLRPYEQVEWARAELEGWLVAQAFEGMLREVESGGPTSNAATVLGKLAIAELAESVMTRLCRVMGGSTFSRSSPFGNWSQDVRALGFLRPPWGLSFDMLAETTLGLTPS
jgi:alkylation response protein AidB-like acyl-CoA dehydrogenase